MTALGTIYVQIGFKRCGTSSIAAFFNRSGIPAVHWDRGRLALTMRENMRVGRPILRGYEQYSSFTDMEYVAADDCFEGFRHYDRILEDYPEAKFILNTRDQDRWLRSMHQHSVLAGPERIGFYRWRYGTADPERLSEFWRQEWDEHYKRVMADIRGDRLLVFDIEKDSPELLCRFAGLPREMARHYRRENPTQNRLGVMLVRHTPTAMKRMLPYGAKLALRRRLGL